jgi:hypothetical protein
MGVAMNFEREERRLLAALWIDHHGRDRLIDGDELAKSYGVFPPRQWLDSFAAEFNSNGWVTVFHPLANNIALSLKPEGYRHGLAAALELTGGSSLMVNFAQKELIGDGTIPNDMPGGPGWKYLIYAAEKAGALPTAGPMTKVVLDHRDSAHAEIESALDETIRFIEGDNGLVGREDALAHLRSAANLWSGSSIRIIQFRVGVFMAIDDVCEIARETYYTGALFTLRSLAKNFAKEKLHIDLDGIL